MENIIQKYDYDMDIKIKNFEKYVPRQSMSRFLARYELFKKIKNTKGSIVECGVHYGGGVMAWGKLSAALEPYAIHRKVIGFDTFEGFPSISEKDTSILQNINLKERGLKVEEIIYEEILENIQEFDESRYLNQFSKIELVKGDALETIPKYIKDNKHLIVALLFLDFDLYKPTKIALEQFLPRMPKGSIIALDEINNPYWQGETMALLDQFIELGKLEIKKFDFDPNIAYIQL